MNIAIVGYNTEGRITHDYFKSLGHDLTVCDQKTDLEIPEGTESVLGEQYLDKLDRFDLIVRTAGLPPRLILEKNPGVSKKITTHINEFLKACPSRNVIGVTGTKGKGTTSTLIARMLEATGKNVWLGGNIGLPPLTFLDELDKDSWVVLELSSFQLIDIKHSPHIAVCLMVVPEHLNWHPDINEYTQAKSQLFAGQTADDIAIYYAENETSKLIAAAGQGQKVPYFAEPGAIVDNGCISISSQVVCRTDELQLLGTHNWQNACAAVTAVWQVTQDIKAIREVLTSFRGLPFRIEFRAEKNGVRYYNDSYATGIDASLAALASIPGKKVMIMGGFDRMLDLSKLPEELKKDPEGLRKVMLIGASAQRTKEVFDEHGFKDYIMCDATDMKTIVEHATMIAHSADKDAVVLSPGFASFDMFKNFEERGRQFNQEVENL